MRRLSLSSQLVAGKCPPASGVAEPIGEWQAPVTPESPGGDFHAWRGLTPLVLVPVHHRDDLPDRRLVISKGNDVRQGAVLLDIGFEDGVQYFVGGQGVLIGLVVTELSRRRPANNGLRDQIGRAHV